ncbi:hypothetical protein H6F53_00985 [Trichocoleus sp. FACHB-832]|uniref:hypothetical protein n=1 Tax=Trichocoleus sp. FACHB-832 TaxID=2692875 RepID=UPI00168663BB|nr:hypothetical protein [Trichocoleus sp. FACHB-832]MBD1904080.1 hypothetical protein [Trichocoleus sp. FACHB-832]
MSINSSLIQGIRNRLGSAVYLGVNTSSATSDLFEFYIFSIIIRAALNEGANVYYEDIFENNTNYLDFRQSPGEIYGNSQAFTHAVLNFGNNKPLLEVHIGIKVKGQAQVAQECDVCVLYQEEASRCRKKKEQPRSSKVLIVAECKHYSSNLPLYLARSFIGLNSTLTRIQGDCYFVSNSTSKNVIKLLANKPHKWAHYIVPGNTNDLNKLMYAFQLNFQDFKAKY